MSYANTYGVPPSDSGYAPPPSYDNPSYPAYGGAGSQSAPSYAPPSSYGPPPTSYGGAPYGAPGGQSYGGPLPYPGNPDEPRTLFITGFPNDVKERELNNLCRFLPGYQASQMHWKNGVAQGFAIFTTNGHARAACDALRQLCFDETSVLRADMAKKNMYLKDDPSNTSFKRPRTEGPPPAERGFPSKPFVEQPDNPPCNTLYVGNLAHGVSEQELVDVFSKGRGFIQLKLTQGAKFMACFIEYEDIGAATDMHTTNQGLVLRTSDRGPIRVMFSKTPFGRGKKEGGQLSDSGFAAKAAANAAAIAAAYAPPEYKPDDSFQ